MKWLTPADITDLVSNLGLPQGTELTSDIDSAAMALGLYSFFHLSKTTIDVKSGEKNEDDHLDVKREARFASVLCPPAQD